MAALGREMGNGIAKGGTVRCPRGGGISAVQRVWVLFSGIKDMGACEFASANALAVWVLEGFQLDGVKTADELTLVSVWGRA